MGKHQERPPAHSRPRKKAKLGAGLSLNRLIKSRASSYDPRAVKEKERALNAKTVNKYKKLKQRLKDKLQPATPILKALEEGDEDGGVQPGTQQPAVSSAAAHLQSPLTAVAAVAVAAAAGAPEAEEPPVEEEIVEPASQGEMGLGKRQTGGSSRPQQQQQQQRHEERGAGKKQHKPSSQLQRLAAEVQAQKEEAQRQRAERARAAAERAAKLEADRKRRAQQNKLFRKKTHGGQPVMKYRIDKVLQQLGAA